MNDTTRIAEDRKPNKVVQAISTLIGKIRADADMVELLQTFAGLNPDAIEKSTPAEARRNPTMADAVDALLRKQGRSTDPEQLVPGITSKDVTVQGAVGSLPARLYTPAGTGPFPVIVYFHGGGWVIADKQVYDGGARGLASHADSIVVSVDYRRAPEHTFPAAWDDAFAAYAWIAQNIANVGGDPTRIALAGESAGGNLAIATAVAAREAGLTPPRHVLSVYPVAQTSLNTESEMENAIAVPLNRAMIRWFVSQVINSPEDLKDTRLNLVAADLRGLPPVTIISARLDPLRSDGTKLEKALKDAGVPVERRDFEGVTHEFFGCAAVLAKARDAQAFAGQRLKESFAA